MSALRQMGVGFIASREAALSMVMAISFEGLALGAPGLL
jgi:hypothetical protein